MEIFSKQNLSYRKWPLALIHGSLKVFAITGASIYFGQESTRFAIVWLLLGKTYPLYYNLKAECRPTILVLDIRFPFAVLRENNVYPWVWTITTHVRYTYCMYVLAISMQFYKTMTFKHQELYYNILYTLIAQVRRTTMALILSYWHEWQVHLTEFSVVVNYH